MDLNNGVCGHDHPCFKLIEEVRWRLSDVEAYTLSHVDRDANKFANVFAHYVVRGPCCHVSRDSWALVFKSSSFSLGECLEEYEHLYIINPNSHF